MHGKLVQMGSFVRIFLEKLEATVTLASAGLWGKATRSTYR